jgi:hypothetical protein
MNRVPDSWPITTLGTDVVSQKEILIRTGIAVIGLPLLALGIIKGLEYLGEVGPKAEKKARGSSAWRREFHRRKALGIANPRGQYYVKTRGVRERGRWIKGWTRGPYTLSSAKDYARIGSQFGRTRTVHFGKSGPMVRRYSGGKRI